MIRHGRKARMSRIHKIVLGALVACASIASPRIAAASPGDPATTPQIVSAAEKEGKLVVYSTTDSAAVQPMLKDFAALHPNIAVEYDDMNSTELYNRFVSEAAAGAGSADLLWS